MSTLPPTLGGFPPPPPDPLRRFTVAEYQAMVGAGILTQDDLVELLEGLIVMKMPRNPPHDLALELTLRAFLALLPTGFAVRSQSAIATLDSQPEPDLAVARGGPRTYANRHPGPTDVCLVIEVSDSTLARDRGVKARLYARAGIPCYWIVNLVDGQVEISTDPTGPDPSPSYRTRQDFRPGTAVPLVIDGQQLGQIAVADLLP
jgi:Uma2 family endonuclease